jgi:hypothetical protein
LKNKNKGIPILIYLRKYFLYEELLNLYSSPYIAGVINSRTKSWRKNKITIKFQEAGCKDVDRIQQAQVPGSLEYDNEHSGFIKGRKLLDQLSFTLWS